MAANTQGDPTIMWHVQQPATLRSPEAFASASVARLPFPTQLWQGLWSPWWPRLVRISILLLTDMLALLAAATVGYLLWARPVLQQSPALYADLLPLLWLFPLGYAGMGLYPGFGVGAVETLRRLSNCTTFAFLVLAAASFALKLPAHYSRMTFAIAWGASLATVPLWRFLVLSVASR